MKVFISWSGERSHTLAQALHEWLPMVLQYSSPWLSSSDIQPGERWSAEVAKSLEDITFGIFCITRENMNAPWILFEAGALAKSMQNGRVIPLLLDLGIQEISGPLAQFQAKKTDLSGIKELVISLNKVATTPLADTTLDRVFEVNWGGLETKIKSIPNTSNQ